jgi:hypothetical protein
MANFILIKKRVLFVVRSQSVTRALLVINVSVYEVKSCEVT